MQNQNYFNNGGYYGQPMAPGQAFGVPMPKAANTQPLTEDQVKMLRQNDNKFDLKIDQTELLRAICTHKDPINGQSTLISNPDGTYTCTICGATFPFFEGSVDDVRAAVQNILNIMQTDKALWLDAPEAMTRNFYQLIPLLMKLPAIHEMSVKNFAKYENNANNPMSPMGYGYSGFNALQNLMFNPYPAYGAPMQQPMAPQYGMPAQQPMANQYGAPMQQPMVNPYANGWGASAAPVAMNGAMDPNPMAYNAPVAPSAGVMPTAQQSSAPAAPAPAAAPAEVQQQKTFNV